MAFCVAWQGVMIVVNLSEAADLKSGATSVKPAAVNALATAL